MANTAWAGMHHGLVRELEAVRNKVSAPVVPACSACNKGWCVLELRPAACLSSPGAHASSLMIEGVRAPPCCSCHKETSVLVQLHA